jgi:hypothetical protein
MSLEDQSWSQGPKLNTAIIYHSCGVFKSSAHQGRTVVIDAGGPEMESVEILDFSTADTWVEGMIYLLIMLPIIGWRPGTGVE